MAIERRNIQSKSILGKPPRSDLDLCLSTYIIEGHWPMTWGLVMVRRQAIEMLDQLLEIVVAQLPKRLIANTLAEQAHRGCKLAVGLLGPSGLALAVLGSHQLWIGLNKPDSRFSSGMVLVSSSMRAAAASPVIRSNLVDGSSIVLR